MDRFSNMNGRSEPMIQMVRFDCCISKHDKRIFDSNVIGLTENKIFSDAQHIIVTLLFNNHIIMTSSDNESELSEASIITS